MYQNPKLMVDNDQMDEDRRRARENTLQNLAGYIIVIGVINLIGFIVKNMKSSKPVQRPFGYVMTENRTPLF